MKLEFNMADITRDDLIAAMADKLLTSYVREEDTNSTYPTHSPLAEAMRKLIDQKISALAQEYVRNTLDDTIRARISATVDAVIADGWQQTNSYGEPSGKRITLKERVSDLLLKAQDRYDRSNWLDKQIKAAAEGVLTKEFKAEIDAAKAKVRAELDAVLTGKVTEALKSAIGLKP